MPKKTDKISKADKVHDEELARRQTLTFEQAEGEAELPCQLKAREVSQELRSYLWAAVYGSMTRSLRHNRIQGTRYFASPWIDLLQAKHIFRDHKMADDFSNDPAQLIGELKRTYLFGDYVEVLGFTQWLLRETLCPVDLRESVEHALNLARSAYALFDGDTIAPISSDEEAATLTAAFEDTSARKFGGAHTHLKSAAEELTKGNWPGSVRESIHAVEATAKIIAPASKTLDPALTTLEKQGKIHGALRKGFLSLYGFTSDEEGIRHSLLEKPEADVDEIDAQYMLGACAAFVSYLLNKTRTRQ